MRKGDEGFSISLHFKIVKTMATRWIRYGLGLDMSKDTFHACLGGYTREGEFKVIAQRQFKNSKKGFDELVEWLEKNRKEKTLDWQILMEVTGVYHEGLLYHLHSKGFPVCLELAKRVKKYIQSIGHKSKNDKLDGRGISQMACERKLNRWKPISPQIHSIRTMLRHRKALIAARVQFENQLHALKHAASDERMVERSLRRMIKELNTEIDKAQAKATELAKQNEPFFRKISQIAESVKGLGILTVLIVVSETNGFEEFTSIKQLVSYAGYDVVENSSGKFTGKTKISKQGNARIRAALHMPSLSMIGRKVEPFYSLYMRLVIRTGGIKMKAVVAIQRKLLVLIYTLWKRDERFDKTRYQAERSANRAAVLELEVAPM